MESNGRIYNIPLQEINGDTVVIRAFAVDSILSEKIGREKVKLNPEDFPHLTKQELQEASKSLPKKHLDILIGNPDLGLQPVCRVRFGCPDCRKGRCIYKSRFSEGVIPLGSFSKNAAAVSSIKHVALTKVIPPLQGLFFQVEALGVSPIERCTDCKLKISQCRICSSETAILTATEEEEYNVLKEHFPFCKESDQLHDKYPFKKDPGVLLDNGREAKACQISQERRQIKNGTHNQYMEKFKDMVSRNVV